MVERERYFLQWAQPLVKTAHAPISLRIPGSPPLQRGKKTKNRGDLLQRGADHRDRKGQVGGGGDYVCTCKTINPETIIVQLICTDKK